MLEVEKKNNNKYCDFSPNHNFISYKMCFLFSWLNQYLNSQQYRLRHSVSYVYVMCFGYHSIR